MKTWIWLVLTAFLSPSSASHYKFCREIEALHEKLRFVAVQREEKTAGNFHSFDFNLGRSLLELWLASSEQESSGPFAERLVSYARTCSRPLIDALFAEFKSEVFPQIDSLNCEISETTAKLFTAEARLIELKASISVSAWRFGRVNEFIEKLINTDLNPYAYSCIENIVDKETELWRLSVHLRDCPEEEIDHASAALIEFLRNVAKDQTALGIFDLCQHARMQILDKRSTLRKARKEAGRLVNTVNTLRNRLNELTWGKVFLKK